MPKSVTKKPEIAQGTVAVVNITTANLLPNIEQSPFLQILSREDWSAETITEQALRYLDELNDTPSLLQDPLGQDQNFVAAIHIAATKGLIKIIETLVIGFQENINRKDKFGRIPLHYAAISGDIHTMRLLKNHGGDYNSRDLQGLSPLDLLTRINEEAIKLLVEPDPLFDQVFVFNELHRFILENDLSKEENITRLFALTNDPNMLKLTPNGAKPSELAEAQVQCSESKLAGINNRHHDSALVETNSLPLEYVKLLQFIENWRSIKVKFTIKSIMLNKGCINSTNYDIQCVDLSIELLQAIKDIGYQNNQFYKNNMKQALGLLLDIANAISWHPNKHFSELKPLQNIDQLFTSNNGENPCNSSSVYKNKALELFITQTISTLLQNFRQTRAMPSAIRCTKDHTNRNCRKITPVF